MLGWLHLYQMEIGLGIFCCITLVVLFYYLFFFVRFSFHKPLKVKNLDQTPVSIILTARNEAHHLIKSLPVLLKQQYNHYEVVLVNDNSTDETEQVAMDFMVQYPHLKFVNLTSSVTNIQGKKFPLSIGIKSAKNELLLLTDADCIPSSPYWLQNMARHFKDKIEIVLGYSTYEKKRGLLNFLIHFDTLHTGMQYFSYALAKIPYMGVGQNLAYTKSLFYSRKGFASHNHIRGGDDDIFVGKVATKSNCTIEYAETAYTVSRSKSGMKVWMSDKRRHTYTRRYYRPVHQFLLTTYDLFNLLFYLSLVLGIVFLWGNLFFLSIFIAVFLFKTAVQYFIFGKAAMKLKENSVIPYILPMDALFSIINPFVYIIARISPSKRK